jgi:hypothetical protein
MLKFKKWVLNNKLIIIGTIIGGIIGFIYYSQIECGEALCVIGANPFNSIIYFSVFSGFLTSLIQAKIADNKRK